VRHGCDGLFGKVKDNMRQISSGAGLDATSAILLDYSVPLVSLEREHLRC
jgi:hypothetical protein